MSLVTVSRSVSQHRYCKDTELCKGQSFGNLMIVYTLYFTATLISLRERVDGTTSLYEGPRQLKTDVSTTRDKLISFCHHRRVCLAVILLLLLVMILVTLVVYFTYNSGNDVTRRTFYPPPEGKSSTSISVQSSRFLFINFKIFQLVTHIRCTPLNSLSPDRMSLPTDSASVCRYIRTFFYMTTRITLVLAGSAAVAAISVCRESGSTHLVQCIAVNTWPSLGVFKLRDTRVPSVARHVSRVSETPPIERRSSVS